MKREDEPEEFALAELCFRELRTWLIFRDTHEPWIAASRSVMELDDQLTKPHQVSHNIANAVVSAVDHLHALDSIMLGAGASHTLAPFSLIRGAIESAAQAAWISAPEDHEQRILRSLSLSAKWQRSSERIWRVGQATPAGRRSVAQPAARSLVRHRTITECRHQSVKSTVPARHIGREILAYLQIWRRRLEWIPEVLILVSRLLTRMDVVVFKSAGIA
jgi:hypothetical protein